MKTPIVFAMAAAAALWAQDVPRTRGGTTENPPVNQPRSGSTAGEVPTAPRNRQELEKPNPGRLPATKGMSLTAKLLDPAKQGREKAAVVQVNVAGIRIVDPDQSGRKAKPGEGHLLYRLDGGPVIATTATKLGFRELGSGRHKIDITLAANDGTLLGPKQIVDVDIP